MKIALRPSVLVLLMGLMVGGWLVSHAHAQDDAPPPNTSDSTVDDEPTPDDLAQAEYDQAIAKDPRFVTDTLWILIAAGLVFIMHLGFAMVESGLTPAKSCVNILFKNTAVVCLGILTYALVGFSLMYPGFADGTGFEWLGFAGVGLTDTMTAANKVANNTRDYAAYTYNADFLFQAMFCATAATIVSGAVAGRIKLLSFLIFTTVFTAVVYPWLGSWHWGYGWVYDMGFHDFAGSTIVHSIGGWGALTGAIILGPRLGKYAKGGASHAIPGHSFPLATIGVFLLWWGWFGFNGGSVLSADPAGVSLVLVTTCLAAAAGAVAAMAMSWVLQSKPDLSMALNGVLAGLVAITAGADQMNALQAVIIGAIGGVLVVAAVLFIDQKLRIDDPVGAVSVHLVNGVWGTLAVGIFGAKGFLGGPLGAGGGFGQLVDQIVGVAAIGAAAAVLSLVLWLALKFTLGIRVSEQEEIEGLDLGEHDQAAYPDFQTTYIKSYHVREI